MKARALCAAGFLLAAAGSAQAQDCKLTIVSRIAMAASGNRILVPVSIAGATRQFALDLEDGLNGISQATVDDLKIPTNRIDTRKVTIKHDGQEVTRLAFPEQFRLGQLDLPKLEFVVLPAGTSPGPDGVLGMMLFQNLDFELDVAHRNLNLFLPSQCGDGAVYWTQSAVAALPFERDSLGFLNLALDLDGKPVRARLATGGIAYIGMNAMRHIFGIDENSPGVTPVDAGTAASLGINEAKGEKLYAYAFKSLAAGGLTVGNPKIFLRGEPVRRDCRSDTPDRAPLTPGFRDNSYLIKEECWGGFDLHLSPALLGQLHFYFSSKDKIAYVTPADAH
jgi:hypothetical protein